MPSPIAMATLGVITNDRSLGLASLGLFGFTGEVIESWKKLIEFTLEKGTSIGWLLKVNRQISLVRNIVWKSV